MAEVPILVSTRMGGRAVYCGGIKSDGSRWRGEFSCNEEAALSRLLLIKTNDVLYSTSSLILFLLPVQQTSLISLRRSS